MSKEDRDAAVAALAQYGSIRKAAVETGVPYSTFHKRLLRAAALGETGGPPIPPMARPPVGFVVRKNSGKYDQDGNLIVQWVQTGRGNVDGYEVPEGHTVKGESTLLDSGGNVVAQWVKTKKEDGVSVEELTKALKEAFATYDGAAGALAPPGPTDGALLTVYPIPDLHFGMYAYGKETGEDYDTAIAADVARSAVTTLVSQSLPSEHAVVLVLGDYFHQNDQSNVTPGRGHRLDVDGRWSKVYHDGAVLLLEIIKQVATKHRLVEIKILPGNHDEDAAVTLTVAMSLFFSGDERITVNKRPGVTWYRRFGKCLMGAHHGHTQKPETMAMAMAVDCAADWGLTTFRTMYFGHIHHRTAKEVMGVTVESFSSPAAKDSYAHSYGYRAMRSMVAITHHRDLGEVARHTVAVFDSKREDVT